VELDRRSRAAIVAAALACFVGAFGFAPLSARSAGTPPPFPSPDATQFATVRPLAVISPQRDPFTGARDTEVSSSSVPPTIPRIPAAIGGLPSNLTGMIPLIPGTPGSAGRDDATRISAVATGLHPYALVVEGTQNVLKAIGDRIDGLRIVGITIDGVILEGGRLRRVTSALPQVSSMQGLPAQIVPLPVGSASLPVPVATPSPPGSPQ